jgi:hypothetical protein
MGIHYCKKCKAAIDVPSGLKVGVKDEVTSLRRQNRSALAINSLRAKARLPLAEAKAIVLHVTQDKGLCHRCGEVLSRGEESVCIRCGAVNLDW